MMKCSRMCAICSHLLPPAHTDSHILKVRSSHFSLFQCHLVVCRCVLQLKSRRHTVVKNTRQTDGLYNLRQWSWSSFAARELCLWLPHHLLRAALLSASTRLVCKCNNSWCKQANVSTRLEASCFVHTARRNALHLFSPCLLFAGLWRARVFSQ